ncbi:hypothetical protein X801_04901, partial [Opisthorchis viverrini]
KGNQHYFDADHYNHKSITDKSEQLRTLSDDDSYVDLDIKVHPCHDYCYRGQCYVIDNKPYCRQVEEYAKDPSQQFKPFMLSKLLNRGNRNGQQTILILSPAWFQARQEYNGTRLSKYLLIIELTETNGFGNGVKTIKLDSQQSKLHGPELVFQTFVTCSGACITSYRGTRCNIPIPSVERTQGDHGGGYQDELHSCKAVRHLRQAFTDLFKRSCDIVARLAEKINAKLLIGEGVNKPNKGSSPTSLSPQEYRVYAQLKFKSQTMVASTSLFVTVAECLMMAQQQTEQRQQELRKLSRENRELKADIAYSIERIHDAEGKLAAAKEETSYWHLLCSLSQLDYELYLAEDDSESWYEPVRYDSLWNAEYAGSAGTEVNAIIAEVDYSSADELIKRINEKSTPDIQDIPTYASLLELVARRFFEVDDFDSCSVLLDKVITLRRQTYTDTHPIIAATLVCLSITYGGQKKFREAQKLIGDALDILKQHPEPGRYREIIAGQYKRIGQKLISWGQPQAGIRVMQQSMRLLEDLLPKEETQWCDVINRMARICNDRGYFDDAMTLLCDVVDYYHGRQHGHYAARIPTIVEVAYAHQLAKHNPVLDLSNFSIPPSSLLSRPLVTALK